MKGIFLDGEEFEQEGVMVEEEGVNAAAFFYKTSIYSNEETNCLEKFNSAWRNSALLGEIKLLGEIQLCLEKFNCARRIFFPTYMYFT